MNKDKALKLALEALELAQDNLRNHGDNCFLHDEGEYNRCFCGKDSLSDHLQSVVEKLDEALAQPEQEPVAWVSSEELLVMRGNALGGAKDWRINVGLVKQDGDVGLYTTPPQRTWVGLTDEELAEFSKAKLGSYDLCLEVEAKLKEKNT